MVQKIALEPPEPIFVLRVTINNSVLPQPQIDAVALLESPDNSCGISIKPYYYAVNVVSYSTTFGPLGGFDDAYTPMQALGPPDSRNNRIPSDVLGNASLCLAVWFCFHSGTQHSPVNT